LDCGPIANLHPVNGAGPNWKKQIIVNIYPSDSVGSFSPSIHKNSQTVCSRLIIDEKAVNRVIFCPKLKGGEIRKVWKARTFARTRSKTIPTVFSYVPRFDCG
jgi:hypothetical protein